MSDAWRREGSCGACQFFEVDFGSAPTYYGHCKMHPRKGARSSNDASCREFRPLPGFDDRVNLHEKELSGEASSPTYRGPSEAEVGSGGDPYSRVQVHLRKAGESKMGTSNNDDTKAALLAALPDPSGSLNGAQLEDAMLDTLEELGALLPVHLEGILNEAMLKLVPKNQDLKSYDFDIDTFFKKITMIREKIRVFEQKINNHKDLGFLRKAEFQQELTKVYASLTAFHPLFRPNMNRWHLRGFTRRSLKSLVARHLPKLDKELAPKWTGGHFVIENPQDDSAQVLPIEIFFERLLRLQKSLEALSDFAMQEAAISDIHDVLSDYIGRCYGSLTSFNILFLDREDGFSSK